MSTGVTTLFTTQFEPILKHAYQREQPLLKGKARYGTAAPGSSVKFRKGGTATMMQKARHGDIPMADLTFTEVTITPEDYWLRDLINDFDQNKTNIALQTETAKILSFAAARRWDQTFIDALDDSTPGLIITAASLTPAVIQRAKKELMNNDVPLMDIYGVIGPDAADDLFSSTEYTSVDFNEGKPIVAGLRSSFNWQGVNWTVHTGLTDTGTADKCYVWHKEAVGVVEHEAGPSLRADFVAEKGEMQVAVKMSLGAGVIDTRGIVELTVTR